MKETRLAIRYAKALLELAIERNIQDKIYSDMEYFSKVCRENREFNKLLKNPVINSDKKIKILKEIFTGIDSLSMNFILLITNKNRESYIYEIAKKYIELYKEHKGIKTAIIETPVKLEEKAKKEIIDFLTKETNAIIELNEKINKELIGGFKLTFDDKQYDTSIFTKLQELRRDFNINLYEKGF